MKFHAVTKMSKHHILVILLAMELLFSTLSCSNYSPMSTFDGLAEVTSELKMSDVTRVEVVITGSGMDDISQPLNINDDDVVSGLIMGIPAGKNRQFTINAYIDAEIVCTGTAIADIVVNQRAQVFILVQCEEEKIEHGEAEITGEFNFYPVIQYAFADSSSTEVGENVGLTVQASDPDGDPLSYLWTATGGTFLDDSSAATTWIAPRSPGSYTIKIEVSDIWEASAFLEVELKVTSSSEIGWTHSPAGTLSGSRFAGGSNHPRTCDFSLRWNKSDISGGMVSGDVDGDGRSEVVVSGSSMDVLVFKDDTSPALSLQPGCNRCSVAMLEDFNQDGVLDIAVGTNESPNLGLYFLRGNDGSVIKTFSRSGGYDAYWWPISLLPTGELITRHDAGYSWRTFSQPRGVSSLEFETGDQNWFFGYGPRGSQMAIGDIEQDGKLDYLLSTWTPHNGCSANGTTDGDVWALRLNASGNSVYSRNMGNGFSTLVMADLDGDGVLEVIKERGQNGSYPGTSRIHILDPITGNSLAAYDGPSNARGTPAVADLDNDGIEDLVVGFNTGEVVLFDGPNLQVVASISGYGSLQFIADVDGDGAKEIVVKSPNGLSILAGDLSLKGQIDVGATVSSAIPVDIDGDGGLDIAVLSTNGLSIYSSESNHLPVSVTLDFEEGLEDWTTTNIRTATNELVTDRVHNGSAALKCGPSSCGANCYGSNEQAVELTRDFAGACVDTVTYWVLEDGTNSPGFGESVLLEVDGTFINPSCTPSTNGVWEQCSHTVQQSVNTLTIFARDISSTGALWLDDIQVTLGSDCN